MYIYIYTLFIVFYILFIYSFILFYFLFFISLPPTRSEFQLRGVSIYILVGGNLFIYLIIYLGVPWASSFLVQLDVDGIQFHQQ